MKSEVLVRVRDEDPDIQKQRQELVRSKSPVELAQMSSISDFPVPANIEKLMQKPRYVKGQNMLYMATYFYITQPFNNQCNI